MDTLGAAATTAGTEGERAVEFGTVAVGEWFKDVPGGTWHLKTSPSRGAYQSWGTRYEPQFCASEQVMI